MIDISFLTPPPTLKMYSGREFIDYQGKAFFQELADFIATIYNPEIGTFDWSLKNRKTLTTLIANRTGIRVNIQVDENTRYAITAAFVSPNSVLNKSGAEKFLSKDETNINKFFKEFKKDVMVGWCDLKTGRVEGDFKNVEFILYMEVNDDNVKKALPKIKSNITVQQGVAAAILHELGHAFFSLYFLSASIVEDIFFMKTSALVNNETNTISKIKIIRDFKNETGIDVSEEVNKTGKMTVIGFEKGKADRDYQRTLSFGVTRITPEIMANIYAVRMGASLALSTYYVGSAFRGMEKNKIALTELCVFPILYAVGIPLGPLFLVFCGNLGRQLSRIGIRYNTSSHESPYNTIKTILRDTIDLLRKARNSDDKKVVDELIKDAMFIDELASKAKSSLEGSYLANLAGYLLFGKDRKKIEIENYTSELNYNPLSLYIKLNNPQ